MPFLYDSASDLNMLQSGLHSPDYANRQRLAGEVRQQQQAEFAQKEAMWSGLATQVGGLASKAGTAAAGGNPDRPGSLGQGYFNSKASDYFQTKRNDALGAELAKQNIADAALSGRPAGTAISTKADVPDSGVFAGRTATATPPPAPSKRDGGGGRGITSTKKTAPATSGASSAVQRVMGILQGGGTATAPAQAAGTAPVVAPPKAATVLPTHSTQAATTALAGNIPAANAAAQTAGAAQAAGAAVQSTQAGVASATQAVQAAQADYVAAVKKHGPDSPQAQAAQSRVVDAQRDATEAVRVHQGSVGNAGMVAARRSGNATALYDNGSTAVNLVNHMGQPVLVATINGQTFEIDDATADAITGLTTNHENLTDSQLERNMVMERYEQAKYDRAMQQQLNQGMNEFIYQTWMEDPYNKRNENWEAAEAALTAMRPMLKYMDPGEFMQVIEDITEVMKMGDPTTAQSQRELLRETLARRVRDGNDDARRQNGYTVKHHRDSIQNIDSEIASATEALAEAMESEMTMSGKDTSPAIIKLDEQLAELIARRKMVNGDLESAEERGAILTADRLAMYEPDLGTDNLLVFADDFSNQSPVENIIKSVLFANGLYDPKTKTVSVDELAALDESVLMGYIREFESKAENLGWASTPSADDMWLQHLQHMGVDVDLNRVDEFRQQQALFEEQRQQQLLLGQGQPSQQQPSQQQPTQQQPTQQQPTAQPTVDVNTLQLADISKDLAMLGGLKPIVDKALSGEALSDEEYRVLTMNIAIYLRRQFVSKEDVKQLIEKWGIQVGKTPGTPQGHYPRQVM